VPGCRTLSPGETTTRWCDVAVRSVFWSVKHSLNMQPSRFAVPEETMADIDGSEFGSASTDTSGILYQVTADLTAIAAVVDRASEASNPMMDLLEASRALHTALVFLSRWSSARGDEIQMVGVGIR
jgi:hypothetical protein